MKNESSINHSTPPDANNVLEAGLSLIQAKYAAMIEGKKIRHSSFIQLGSRKPRSL